MFGNAKIDRRLARVERKLDLIIEHLGIDPYAGIDRPAGTDRMPLATQSHGEIDALLLMGKKIHAVKEYRAFHPGVSLAEAVDAIEDRTRELGL